MNSHSHIFIPSKKKDLCYCKICCKLSYKGKMCQTLPLNDEKRIGLDPLTLKFKPNTSVCNYKLPNNIKYLEYKNKGFSKIKYIIKNFGLKSMIYYKSITFMNQIFFENDISLDYIENIAIICVLLAIKYNEHCISQNLEEKLSDIEKDIIYHLLNSEQGKTHKSNFRGFFSFIKKNVDNYKYWEIICLQYLNYDLGRYSTYDYLILFFELGLFFCEKKINIIDKLKQCINILDLIIYDKKYCDFSQYTLALSIINIVLENDDLFDKKLIKYIYGIDLSKSKYIKCTNVIKNILNQSKRNEYLKYYFNMLYNSFYLNNLNNKGFEKIKKKKVNINKYIKYNNDDDEEEKTNQMTNNNGKNNVLFEFNKNLDLAQLKNMIINNNYKSMIFDNNINNNNNNFVFNFNNNKCINNSIYNFNFLINYYYLNNIDLFKNCMKNFQ